MSTVKEGIQLILYILSACYPKRLEASNRSRLAFSPGKGAASCPASLRLIDARLTGKLLDGFTGNTPRIIHQEWNSPVDAA